MSDAKTNSIVAAVVCFTAIAGFFVFLGIFEKNNQRVTFNYAEFLRMFNLITKEERNIMQNEYEYSLSELESNGKILVNNKNKNKESKENNSILDTVANVVENKVEKILDKTFILEYPNFNIEYNCDNGNYNYVHYKANKNNYKDIDYSISFHDKVIENCEYDKTIIENFKNLNLDTPKNQPKYSMHLGVNKKLIPSDSMRDTFSRANIIPVQENLNSVGSSLVYLDRIAECHSNKQIEIVSGTIFENIEEDDYFFEKYKMKTPDYLFHILIIDQVPYSYIFPNDPTPLTHKLDSYTESIYNIEKRAGFTLDFLPKEYSKQENLLNLTLKGCS